MTKAILGVAAISLMMIISPSFGQALQPSEYAAYSSGAKPRLESQRQAAGIGRLAVDETFSASLRSIGRRNEMTTKPWAAPVGHRQPNTAEVPSSSSAPLEALDREDVELDRKIRNICRGC
jgi:hypothetical protein